jgi:hypothetical protein
MRSALCAGSCASGHFRPYSRSAWKECSANFACFVFSEVWSGGIPTAASVTVGREDLHPARNIHLLVDAFPPGPQYHPRQPYMKEDEENA